MSLQNRKALRNRVSKRAVWILTDKADMRDFELTQRITVTPRVGSGAELLLLKSIAALVPQTLKIRKLVLRKLEMKEDNLINILKTHERHLQRVDLQKVVVKKSTEGLAPLAARRPASRPCAHGLSVFRPLLHFR